MEESVEFCLKAFWWKSDFIHAWEILLNSKIVKEIQNHFPVFEIISFFTLFFLLLMFKRLPHQTFTVFVVLYFAFKRSFFTLKIASRRNLEASLNLRFIFYWASHIHSSWRSSIEWRAFFLFRLLFLFSITIYLNLFGVRHELRVLDTYLFNEQFLNAHWVPTYGGPQRPKDILRQESHPIGLQCTGRVHSKQTIATAFFLYQMANVHIYHKKFYCSFTFPKFCAMIIFSCTLEEILTLNLKAIHILPRAFSCVFQQMPLTSHFCCGL